MSLRKVVETLPGGKSMLASARLRRRVLRALDEGMDISGLSQAELARRLDKSRSAVSQVLSGDGNVRVETLAEYLDAMGCELVVSVRPVGQARPEPMTLLHEVASWTRVEVKESRLRHASLSESAVPRPMLRVVVDDANFHGVGAA